MSTEDEKSKIKEKFPVPDVDDMGRRDFFVATGKLIIPTLGVLGLSLSGFPRKVEAAQCNSTCASSCSLSCSGRCDDSCVSNCGRACADGCGGSCKGGCSYVCGGCDGSCKTTCSGLLRS